MKINDTLSDVFDVPVMQETSRELIDATTGEVITTVSNDIVGDDFNHTRENLRALLVTGQKALEHALEVAQSSEHPRAFEVVGNLMKQMADVNQQLLDLHNQTQKIEAPSKKDSGLSKTVNNNLFVGTTADLNKLIKDMTKG
jgi:hypothetical protein